MNDEQHEIVQKALDALKILAPDLPVLCIIAFPSDSDDASMICSGGNMSKAHQVLLLSLALEGMSPLPFDETAH